MATFIPQTAFYYADCKLFYRTMLLFFTAVKKVMDVIKNGWFSEINDEWPGEAFSLEVEEILYSGKSKYQDILIFKR